jgi:flagellar assembly protein FliH
MSFTTLVAFDRPLAQAVLHGTTVRRHTDAELAQQTEAAYHRGIDSARAQADQQMLELRSSVEQLRDGVFARLEEIEPSLLRQLRETLPALAVDLAHRLMAGFAPPPELVQRICEEALAQIFPERDGLELLVSPRDAALLAEMTTPWSSRFPHLRITADPALQPGDCQVRSRFGLTDARLATKVAALQHSLTSA